MTKSRDFQVRSYRVGRPIRGFRVVKSNRRQTIIAGFVTTTSVGQDLFDAATRQRHYEYRDFHGGTPDSRILAGNDPQTVGWHLWISANSRNAGGPTSRTPTELRGRTFTPVRRGVRHISHSGGRAARVQIKKGAVDSLRGAFSASVARRYFMNAASSRPVPPSWGVGPRINGRRSTGAWRECRCREETPTRPWVTCWRAKTVRSCRSTGVRPRAMRTVAWRVVRVVVIVVFFFYFILFSLFSSIRAARRWTVTDVGSWQMNRRYTWP